MIYRRDEEDLNFEEASGAVVQMEQHLRERVKFRIDPPLQELEQFRQIIRKHIPGR